MKARRYPNLHYKTSSWKIIKIFCTDDLLHCLTFAKHCICNSSKEEMANRIPFIGLEMNKVLYKWPECCEIASGGHLLVSLVHDRIDPQEFSIPDL
ncbi:hypothetical protein AVEN_111010-1 [Araneus ventricosus]|uniref:Uncharacterized protein n=1 Tax=Araneus ventricosus TaxID=182803 RepID=A0A4Y2GTM2_ARAVE|nr:hypothetical protein AVEN_111010-1 [Araneus ventricosus]